MRALLLTQDPALLEPAARSAGLEIVTERPDVIVCHGGDGVLLGAERDFPGIPKIPLRRRNHQTAALLAKHYEDLLRRVAEGTATGTRLPKLQARCRGESLLAINDVSIRNESITSAARFHVEIEGLDPFGEIVGDGLVVATPFGSAAYYRSITNSVIHVGIGLAFNNSTEPVNHLVLAPESRIRVRITRGPALLSADNNPQILRLGEGDVVDVRLADHQAVILEIADLLHMNTDDENSRRLRWLPPIMSHTPT